VELEAERKQIKRLNNRKNYQKRKKNNGSSGAESRPRCGSRLPVSPTGTFQVAHLGHLIFI
jgi:hypothetical protein